MSPFFCITNNNSTTVLFFLTGVLFPYPQQKKTFPRLLANSLRFNVGTCVFGISSNLQGKENENFQCQRFHRTGRHCVRQQRTNSGLHPTDAVGGVGNPQKHEGKQPEMGAGKAPHVGVLNQRITVRSGKQGQPCFLFCITNNNSTTVLFFSHRCTMGAIVQQSYFFLTGVLFKAAPSLLKIIGK